MMVPGLSTRGQFPPVAPGSRVAYLRPAEVLNPCSILSSRHPAHMPTRFPQGSYSQWSSSQNLVKWGWWSPVWLYIGPSLILVFHFLSVSLLWTLFISLLNQLFYRLLQNDCYMQPYNVTSKHHRFRICSESKKPEANWHLNTCA